MAKVPTTTGFEAHMQALVDNMIDIDKPTVKDSNVDYVKVGNTVGKALNEAEKNVMRAFAFNKDTTKEELSQLGQDLGMTAEEASTVTVDGLRIIGQHVLNQAKSLYEMLTNLFTSKKRTEDQVIANIRA